MKSRERVISALTFEEFDQVPNEMDDVFIPEVSFGKGLSNGCYGKRGSHADEWGCVFEAGEDGVKGEVKKYIINDWSILDSFIPPWDVLENADFSRTDRSDQNSDKFIIHMWNTDPFQRMQYLRGTENLFIDLAYGDIQIYKLRDMIHEFYYKKVELLVNTDVDCIHLEDDWGSQKSLLISPEMWREYFKPLYKDYCDLAHSKGKYVLMHSDGFIEEIIPDLVEIGVNAVNAQLDCMNMERLAERFHGKMAFWGGIDRQYLLPFGTEEEIRSEVRRIAEVFFKYKRTGIVAQCFLDKDSKINNFNVVFDEWRKI